MIIGLLKWNQFVYLQHCCINMSLLKKKGLRSTAFRQQVLEIFEESPHAVTVEQIETAIGEHDRITLYRTIKTFTEKGLIHEIVMPGDIKKLALCHDCDDLDSHEHHHAHQHNHVHFHCEKCDEVLCVEADMPRLNLPGFIVDSTEMQAHGVCPNCA